MYICVYIYIYIQYTYYTYACQFRVPFPESLLHPWIFPSIFRPTGETSDKSRGPPTTTDPRGDRGYKPHTTEEYIDLADKIRDEMTERDVVTRWEYTVEYYGYHEYTPSIQDSLLFCRTYIYIYIYDHTYTI